jgi:glucose/arabinose dehydrogenase
MLQNHCMNHHPTKLLFKGPAEYMITSFGRPQNPADRADGNRKQRGSRRSSASRWAQERW